MGIGEVVEAAETGTNVSVKDFGNRKEVGWRNAAGEVVDVIGVNEAKKSLSIMP